MKKYIEQRLEDLELEVNLIKVKHKLSTLPKMNQVDSGVKMSEHNSNVSSDYLYDHLYSPSLNILSEPDLETTFASPYDDSFGKIDPLDAFSFNLSSADCDSSFTQDHSDSGFLWNPPYPDIIGSWDDHQNNVTDEYGFKMNCDDTLAATTPNEPIATWGFVSNFDLLDKDFIQWLNSPEVKPLYNKFNKQRSSTK